MKTPGWILVCAILALLAGAAFARPERHALPDPAPAPAEPATVPLYLPSLVPAGISFARPARDERAERLARAMRRLLVVRIPGFTNELADAEARHRDVDGLARVLVEWVDARVASGGWLPLSRDKAAAFLAAVAFHESSWRWRSERLRGARGERCAMQVIPQVLDLGGFDPAEVSRDVGTCLEASTWLMERCARLCGDDPAERWFGCYASGRCGSGGGVVGERFATARELFAWSSP